MRVALGATTLAALLGACEDTCGARHATREGTTPRVPESVSLADANDVGTALPTSVSLNATDALDATASLDAASSTMPVIEAVGQPAGCPSLAAIVKLEARQGYEGRLELHACPMLPEGAGGTDYYDAGQRRGGLEVLDANGHLASKTELEAPSASLEVVDAYGNGRPVFVVEVDLSCGMGSYCGPRAEFFEVKDGQVRWISVHRPGKESPLWLIKSLNNEWRLSPARQGRGLDILATSTFPDFDAAALEGGGYAFLTSFRRYSHEGDRWVVHERETANAGDYETPPESAFP
jgi:hypothetical protein